MTRDLSKTVDDTAEVEISPLDHPMTLRIFLYFKMHHPEDIGIREMQRYVGVKSTSTVSWHFKKLIEADLIFQTPDKRYGLTDLGSIFHKVKIPIDIPAQFILGRFIPKYSLIMSVLVTGLLLLIILLLTGANPSYVAFSSISVILFTLIMIIREWLEFQGNFKEFFEIEIE